MKPIKKKTAKIFIVLIVIAAVFGTIFTFVPMTFSSGSFTSLLGAVNVSTDLGAGVYAEYDLDGDYSTNQINRSISIIKGVLENEGYSGSNIFAVNGEKIRIEIGYPTNDKSLKDSYTLLSAIGVGVFELRSSSSADDTYIVGKDHIESVEINTYNSSIYVVLNFNSAGEEAYSELLEATSTIYVCMGGETMTSFSSSNATASSSLPLSFTDYESAEDFAMKVKLGSMEVGLNSDTVVINTMSSSLTNGNMTADTASDNFNFSITKVAGILAIVFVIVLGLAYMAIKYGVIGLFQMIAMLFDAIIAVVLLWALPWIEISFSSIIAIAFGFIILIASSLIFVSRFEEEYNQGKTVAASFESAYKKSASSILATGIALTIIFGIVAIVAGAELRVFGLITCIFSCLSLFSSLVMLPGFIKIFEAFNDGATKPYRLKAREDNYYEKEKIFAWSIFCNLFSCFSSSSCAFSNRWYKFRHRYWWWLAD